VGNFGGWEFCVLKKNQVISNGTPPLLSLHISSWGENVNGRTKQKEMPKKSEEKKRGTQTGEKCLLLSNIGPHFKLQDNYQNDWIYKCDG